MTYKEYVAKKNAGTLTATSTPVTTYAEYRKRKDSGLLLTDADFSSGTNEATDWVKKYQGLMAEAREAGGDTSLLSADYRERIGNLLAEYDVLKDYGKTIYKNFDKYAQQLMALGGKYDTATGTPKDLYAVKPTNNWTGVILGDNPVMQTPEQLIAPTSEAENNTWFQKGALEGGVTFGNVGKAILGTHQDVGENLYAGVISMGEKVVDTLATIAPYIVNGMFYQNGGGYAPVAYQQMHNQAIDVAKKGTEDFVQQDLYDEMEVAKSLTKYSVGNLVGGSDMSVLGGKSDALVQSGGQMAATLALSSAGVPWWLTTGVTAFGGESENALKQGASLDEAAMSSAIAAGSEILTEKLFGGSGLGEQGLMNLEPLTRGITNRTVKILADYGVDLATEGFEETLTEVINNLGSALYREENLKDILVSEEALTGYLDAFIGGMVMSGAMNVGKVSNHLKQQTDYRSDLTKQEQQVVDKEYERLLAEKDGKLTNKQKNDLYNRVIRDMEKGYISTDTIEEVLGGDTYKAYQDMVNSHDSLAKQVEELTKESDQLEDMVDQEMTGRQKLRRDKLRDLIPELQSKVKENNESTAKKDLKQRLSDEVSELVKNDRLSESYAEKNRVYDKLDIDPDTYKDSKHADAARKTIESAVALDANNTNRVRDLVEHSAQIASETGKAIIFKDNDAIKQSFIERQTKAIKKLEAVENRTEAQNKLLEAMKQKLEDVKSGKVIVNGEYSKDGIIVNIDSKKPLMQTVGHEITHNTESAKSYGKMKDALFAYAKTKGIDAQTLVDMAILEYEGIENAVAEKEVVADLVGEMLFTDDAFVEHLAKTDTNVFKSLWNDIKHLLKMATPGSQEAKELERLQYRFEKAYREANKAKKNTTEDGGAKYSLVGRTADGLGIYKTNYPPNTPKAVKQADLIELVQNTWSKKPITLTIVEDGKYVDITAKFNPELAERSDLSKIAFGNRKGNGPEKRMTLDLASDLYQIAQESRFTFSKDATPKPENPAHDGVTKYHYFLTNLVYKDNDGTYIPCHMNIDVKRNTDGDWFYSFGIEKGSAPQTLLAAVTENSATLPSDMVAQENPGVNKQFTQNITEDQNEHGLDAKDETEYSLSRNTEFMDKAITANESNFHVSSDVMTEAKTVRERIANRMNEIKDRGLVGLPEDIEGNTYIANSSYDGTEENTTICPRSLASEAFVDAVSEYLGRPLSVEEQIYISQDLQGRSLTPECTYCYVATDRKAYRAFLGEYINQRNAVLEKVKENPGADVSRKGDLYKEFLNGRKDTNPMYSRFKMWIDAYKSGKPMVEASHLANINKLMGDINSEFGAELKPQIVDAMKYAQSASWAKKRVNYVAYNGHILNWKQDRINKLNSHYGLRMYSFSDFHPAFVLENMQMITDASVRGLKMLGYTKDTDFVEIFAPSGMNINVSTFGFESGGNVYENNIIGAEWDKAKALREQYPNVGITFVATNDTIVEWALNQDWIDVVIPYHLVRTGTEVAKAFGYTNYTSESADTKDAGWTKGKDNKYIAPTEHNNDKATYMAALEKNHLKPRFARFVDNPNYMKLVNECRQPASKSKPVQPIFNEDAAMTALAKLEVNGYYQPIGGSVDRMYEIAAEVAEDMKNQLAPVQNSLSIADASYEADERFVTGENFRMKQKPADIAPVKAAPSVAETVAPVASYAMDRPKKEALAMEAPIKNDADVAENAEIAVEDVAPMPVVDSTRQVYAEPDDFAPLPTTGKKLRSWPVTSTESDVVDGEIDLEDLDQDKIHYQPISNKKTIGNANAMLGAMGYDKAVSYMKQRFIANKVSLDDIALGERLIQEAVARKDHKTASDLIMDISILGTELGQKVQALSIIKKLTPEGQLKMLYKTIERGKAKGDKAFANIEVTQEQAEKILSARNADGSYDQEKLNAAVEEVKQEIADQMPVTALEKINEWRYLAMLGNPKTHIRNLVSNVAMYATRQVKNAVARTGETIAGNRIERTKTWKMASKDVKEFAKQAADEMYSGDMGNKYSEASSIKSKRDIFRVGALNAAADFNSKALSQEDTWFSKPAYRESLQEYLTANGIRTKADLEKNGKLIAEAKEYAKKQALEATFQQDSYIANKISEIESRNAFLNVGVGAVLPFKKTPINIAKTAVAYSPLGIARNIADAVKVNKGEMAASEAIDHVAQTLTGTSLAVLGFFLAKSGFLNGAGKDDKEGQYDYQLGKQAYSVNINGDTYSLSWLSPVAMPLFVGVNAYEVLVEEKDLDYNVVMDALFKTLDPLNEMSFLSSLNDVLSSYESGMAAFGGMAEAALQSYVTSFIPTLSSQIAQMTDTKKRTTKVAADSGQDFLDDTWNQIKYKFPGLRQTLEPSTDIWGNEIPITDNLITKAFETFLAPYAKKDNIATQVDEEIKNIYRLTGETGVIPNIPDNYITYKDVKYEMSAEDYTQFKKDYGQIAYKLMEQLVSNYTYQRASAVDKADMMKEVFTYARDEAKRNYLAKQGVEYTNATKNNVEYYRENNIKGAIETDMTLDEYVFRRDNPAKYQASSAIGGYDVYQKYAEDTKGMDLAKKAEYISRMDLTIDQKNRLINSETDRKEQIDLTGLENYPSFEEFEYAKENPESYALAKSLGGYEAYKVYAEALGDIKADKNQNGDTISNSRKNKVYNYIYSLDIPDIEKHILFKSQYTSTDTYNRQILEYLDSRDDISWDEMKSILTKLGFKITSSGAIRW